MVPLTKGGSDATRVVVVVVVAARAESNLIARSCFVLRSGGDVKIVEQISAGALPFLLLLRSLR